METRLEKAVRPKGQTPPPALVTEGLLCPFKYLQGTAFCVTMAELTSFTLTTCKTKTTDYTVLSTDPHYKQ